MSDTPASGSRVIGEDEVIARWFAPLAGAGGLGLKDDAALLTPPPGCDLVATVDAIVAGVHFFPDDPPAMIARKALRVNVSDLAAKGAEPAGFLLTLALAGRPDAPWLDAFAQALGEDARVYRCPLLGGDTVRTPGPLSLSVTAFGFVPAGAMVARTDARAGDALYVSGAIGDAALGLALRDPTTSPAWGDAIDTAARTFLVDRYLAPQPRLALAPALRAHASGAMDVSDGLVGDARKMMRASGVGAVIEMARIPLSGAARAAIAQSPALLERALTGGDDYEILASVPQDACAAFERAAQEAGVPVTRIGLVRDAVTGVSFVDKSGLERQFARGSWDHF